MHTSMERGANESSPARVGEDTANERWRRHGKVRQSELETTRYLEGSLNIPRVSSPSNTATHLVLVMSKKTNHEKWQSSVTPCVPELRYLEINMYVELQVI